MPRFKNQHLSYSRLSRFEQCPLSFKLHYIDKKQAEPGVPLRFGKAVHAVLENLVREHMEEEREGPLSADALFALPDDEGLDPRPAHGPPEISEARKASPGVVARPGVAPELHDQAAQQRNQRHREEECE